MRTALFDIRLY